MAKHSLSCPAYGNWQPPYEECTCGADDEGKWLKPPSGEPVMDDILKMIETLQKEQKEQKDKREGEVMAIVKDWMTEAEEEIIHLLRVQPGAIAPKGALSSLIAKHSPFKPGVAYMPVPRCETCKYWHGPQKFADGREQCTNDNISPKQMDEFMTLPGFGCVQWKEK